MAKYFDDPGLVNVYEENNLLADDNSRQLLIKSDDPATFSVRCRPISNNSHILALDPELQNHDWERMVSHESNGHGPLPSYPPAQSSFFHQQSISPSDGADIPLLGFSNEGELPEAGFDDSDHCHTLVSKVHNDGVLKQLLVIAEIIGGYFAGSIAVMTDGAHLFADLVGFLVSLFAIWVGKRQPTKKFSFGFHRAEVLGALGSVAIIWVMVGIFIYMASLRVMQQDFTIDADTMIILSAVGVIINIFMGVVLHGTCGCLRSALHGHSHSHSHGATSRTNINVRAALIHVIGDFIQSVGVLVAAFVIKFYVGFRRSEPAFVWRESGQPLRKTRPPSSPDQDSNHDLPVLGSLAQHETSALANYATESSNLRFSHIYNILTSNPNPLVAIVAGRSTDPDLILVQARRLLRKKLDIHDSTIQIERYQPETMLNCTSCQSLKD
uniref:(California timema) hypothetical protein n=1 Tax=Timema californicum TaxID=61474 RepID=A0A7R9P3U9_TIMCA|nr:unnamed protein product [Timema californicum]